MPVELAVGQAWQLRGLLAAVLNDNPFYSAKLRAAGIDSESAGLEQLPFTVKQELIDDQLAHPPYGTNLTYPLRRYTRFCQTSGTAGKPMRWLDTPQSWDWMLDNWDRVFDAAGVRSDAAIFFAFSFGPFLGFWAGFEAAARRGCLVIPGGGMRSNARLRTIMDTGATVLCCTPTYALRLAEAASEEDIDLADLKITTLIVAGEPGGSVEGTRRHLSDLWHGARIVDHHGMTETGPVSYGCPARPGVLHVIESAFIAEVLDSGELVLTNLGRLGSPLIRYRTGDIVKPAPRRICECGSSDLAREGGILGRTDDMLVIRGVNLYPSAVDNVVRGIGSVQEYRVEIHNLRAMPEMRIQIEHAGDGNLPHRLETALTDAFSLRVPVSVVPPGSLPRFEMKASRWVTV